PMDRTTGDRHSSQFGLPKAPPSLKIFNSARNVRFFPEMSGYPDTLALWGKLSAPIQIVNGRKNLLSHHVREAVHISGLMPSAGLCRARLGGIYFLERLRFRSKCGVCTVLGALAVFDGSWVMPGRLAASYITVVAIL